MKKIRPLHDRILVKREEEGEEKIGGIIIPDSAKEKPQRARSSRWAPARSTTAASASRST